MLTVFLNYRTLDQAQSFASTSLLVNVENLEKGTPLFLVEEDKTSQLVKNSEKTWVRTGNYTIFVQIEGVGGLQEKINIEPSKDNVYNFELKNQQINSNSTQTSGQVLSASQTWRLENFINSSRTRGNISDMVLSPTTTLDSQEIVGPVAYLVSRAYSGELTFENNLIVVSGDEELFKIEDCQIYRAEFDSYGKNLRYFKNCPEPG